MKFRGGPLDGQEQDAEEWPEMFILGPGYTTEPLLKYKGIVLQWDIPGPTFLYVRVGDEYVLREGDRRAHERQAPGAPSIE